MKEGIYEQLINNKINNNLRLIDENIYKVDTENLDEEEAKIYLSTYISEVTRRALTFIREGNRDESLFQQVKVCNEIIDVLSDELADEQFKLNY